MKKKYLSTLKSYIKAGKLPLLLGIAPFFMDKNKKNLEILREKINYSIHKTLKKKYEYSKIDDFKLKPKCKVNNPIWFMWLQGINNAPELCKINFERLKEIYPNRVVLITSDNLSDYIDLPNFIINKWLSGCISNTHFSDIVRISLLVTYGGTWVDSTVFASQELLDKQENFLIPQTFKPGRDGNVIPISSWFIQCDKGNLYLSRVKNLLFQYWKKNNELIDYFLLHHFLMIASEELDNYLDNIAPLDNTLPHYLMLKMKKERISLAEFENYVSQAQLLKFTNKYENKVEKENYERLEQLLKEKSYGRN
ncbi:capsular polysaccharide synthesis protein [Pediococcus acidilactici]|uniref:capsular polysaccharide synthesis protein n=1 Tax=Pediococcus acidilactici TaxID=1254 RepID=UPI001325DF8F|nr:capsular polysaccharide synthesis protein [Pediococcus acidilactici]KAF0337620.1 glycosyl transferase [Pediococcus acidilactici]KAF0348161.1 glycosyl transferase [Pediococcus acidilactici]KAF0463446.1 glycosyl transferase [Pediococcus acidilactici]KAF0502456.1 glycosyl transferase [Pediococcus acidilactici]KAF0511861.1 glycosyl transferase [Pediococcus acidilactici]